MILTATPQELDRLGHLWEHHRFDCHHHGNVMIEEIPGSIGTTKKVTCGCGEVFNITDYNSW